MVKLYASHSSEYFAVREPGRLHLYKDSYQDITHRVHDKMAGELIHLSDAGECFFRSDEGLFRLRREKGVRAERCKAVRDMDGAEGGTLKGLMVRADGEQIAYEQVLPAQKFSSKLKRFLGQKSAQGDVGPRLHRFVVSQWSGRGAICYYETVIDPRTSSGLVWWASADFGYLAVMDRERDGRSQLRLIDILDESVVNELLVEGRLSRDRFLTTNGSVGFGLEKEGKRAFVIWTYGQERYGVPYPKDSRVIHLGKDKVVFLSRQQEIVTVKDYQGKLVMEVSLKPLSNLGIQYLLSFNPRGSLELVTYAAGRLRVHHTDLESLPIDARRWELLGERRRAERLEVAADDILRHDEEVRSQEYQQSRRAELVTDLREQVGTYEGPVYPGRAYPEAASQPVAPLAESVAPEPSPTPVIPFDAEVAHPRGGTLDMDADQLGVGSSMFHFTTREEADEALERLRMRYIAGELTREDYYNEKSVIEKAAATLPKGHQTAAPTLPRSLDFVGE